MIDVMIDGAYAKKRIVVPERGIKRACEYIRKTYGNIRIVAVVQGDRRVALYFSPKVT